MTAIPARHVRRPSAAATRSGCWCGRGDPLISPMAAVPLLSRPCTRRLMAEDFRASEPLDHRLKGIMARRVERPGPAQPIARRMRRIEMRAGNPALGDRLGRGMGPAALQQLRQHMGVRPVGTSSRGRRDRLIDLDPAEPADEDAVRIGARISPIAGLPGSNTARPACWRSCAAVSRSPMRTQKSACGAPRPRSNRIESRSSARSASRSAPSSVSTVRPPIAPSSSDRHSAMR